MLGMLVTSGRGRSRAPSGGGGGLRPASGSGSEAMEESAACVFSWSRQQELSLFEWFSGVRGAWCVVRGAWCDGGRGRWRPGGWKLERSRRAAQTCSSGNGLTGAARQTWGGRREAERATGLVIMNIIHCRLPRLRDFCEALGALLQRVTKVIEEGEGEEGAAAATRRSQPTTTQRTCDSGNESTASADSHNTPIDHSKYRSLPFVLSTSIANEAKM
jgi:hypothetical protein